MTTYDAEKAWNEEYANQIEMAFPSEYVIRIFKGSYPRLNLDKDSFKDKKICDVGCGDGRNLVLLHKVGFDTYGIELTLEIVNKAKSNLSKLNIFPNIRVGTNVKIPFDDNFFDYLLSWNSCNYMGEKIDFDLHVQEFSRILKKDGYLILSIPTKTCFIYHDSKKLNDGYRIIQNDPFHIRNGQVMRIFENVKEIEMAFSKYFKNFIFGSIEDDCFGIDNHWYMIVCQKR